MRAPASFVITQIIVSIFHRRSPAHVMRQASSSRHAWFAVVSKPAAALRRLQVKTFDDDVFPIVSRTIFARLPYGYGALAPVLRAVAALMLLHQAKLEILKIGSANDRMRLRSGFGNALMLRLAIVNLEHGKIPEGHSGIYGSVEPGRYARGRRGSRVMAHALPTACMARKSADGIACIVAASAACRASTSACRSGFQPQGQPPSERC